MAAELLFRNSGTHEVSFMVGSLHRESKKGRHYTLVHIFAKY